MNSYVALHYKATHMSFLHCSYGVGIALSPLFMSKALEKYGSWQVGYRNAGIVQLVIAVILIASLSPVSYTHLDVYKRQGLYRRRVHLLHGRPLRELSLIHIYWLF